MPTPPVQPREAVLRARDVPLRYRLYGEDGFPALLLLSGGPGLASTYLEGVARSLAPHRLVVLLDQRGTQFSPVPEDSDEAQFALAELVADLEALRVHLGFEEWAVLGHSWGGMLGMAYAAAHPERVERLLLVASGGATLEFAATFGANIDRRLSDEDRRAAEAWESPERVAQDPLLAGTEALRAILPGYLYRREHAGQIGAAMERGFAQMDTNVRTLGLLQREGYDLRGGLRSFGKPVLILQGDHDPVATFDDLAALFPHARQAFLAECGHFPWLEQPEAFMTAVTEML